MNPTIQSLAVIVVVGLLLQSVHCSVVRFPEQNNPSFPPRLPKDYNQYSMRQTQGPQSFATQVYYFWKQANSRMSAHVTLKSGESLWTIQDVSPQNSWQYTWTTPCTQGLCCTYTTDVNGVSPDFANPRYLGVAPIDGTLSDHFVGTIEGISVDWYQSVDGGYPVMMNYTSDNSITTFYFYDFHVDAIPPSPFFLPPAAIVKDCQG